MTSNNDSQAAPQPGTSRCSRCGVDFICGAQAGTGSCWCAALPPIDPSPDISGCLCPDCLRDEIATRLAKGN